MNEQIVPKNCPFYKGIEKCEKICMFNVFGVCTKHGSKFKRDKTYDAD